MIATNLESDDIDDELRSDEKALIVSNPKKFARKISQDLKVTTL